MDKKYWIGIITALIILPTLVFSRDRLKDVWAAPEKIEAVSKEVTKTSSTQEQLSKLVLEQQARMEKNEAVYQANLESTKEQLSLIAELKKRK